MNFTGRFLIQTTAPAPIGLGAAPTTEFPLFHFGMGAAGGVSDWAVLPLNTGVGSQQNGWDLAHALLASKTDVAGVPVKVVEPDFSSDYPFTRTAPEMLMAAAGPDSCSQDQPSPDWPNGNGFAWHLGNGFTQLKQARDAVGVPTGTKVRIAHLDTGYSPAHQALPQFLRTDMERNFVEADNPFSAVDPGTDGIMKNPGHGAGTMGIEAARAMNTGKPTPMGDEMPRGRDMMMRASAYGLGEGALVVRTASFSRRGMIAPAAPDAGSTPVPGVEQATQSFLETLFRRGRVDFSQCKPGLSSVPHTHVKRKTHYLVEQNGQFHLRRRCFDDGYEDMMV